MVATGMGGWGVPGVGSERVTSEHEIFWGADQARNAVLWRSEVISGAARDAVNSPTTVLRPGLLMGRITSTNELEEWDSAATDGTEVIAGIIDTELRMQDFDAANQDRVFRVVAARAPLKARKLLIKGAALIGHADEYLARRQLAQAFHILDDDTNGLKSGGGFASSGSVETVTGAADTLTAADNGKLLIYTNVAAVAVTLPAIAFGLSFDIVRAADEEIVVSSAEGDNMIVGHDLSADSITFTTAGQQIGARIRVRAVYVGATLKWLVELPNMPFGTGLTGGFAYAIAT
jgi:hypothetical protein